MRGERSEVSERSLKGVSRTESGAHGKRSSVSDVNSLLGVAFICAESISEKVATVAIRHGHNPETQEPSISQNLTLLSDSLWCVIEDNADMTVAITTSG